LGRGKGVVGGEGPLPALESVILEAVAEGLGRPIVEFEGGYGTLRLAALVGLAALAVDPPELEVRLGDGVKVGPVDSGAVGLLGREKPVLPAAKLDEFKNG